MELDLFFNRLGGFWNWKKCNKIETKEFKIWKNQVQAPPSKPPIKFYNVKIWIKGALKKEEQHNNDCYLDVVEHTTIPNFDWLIVMGDN